MVERVWIDLESSEDIVRRREFVSDSEGWRVGRL
jgi:hypothetical protein